MHRHQGIVFARRIAAQIIQTHNAGHNPMYRLNLQPGFEPQAARLDIRKELA
jgi:hypothetical protein